MTTTLEPTIDLVEAHHDVGIVSEFLIDALPTIEAGPPEGFVEPFSARVPTMGTWVHYMHREEGPWDNAVFNASRACEDFLDICPVRIMDGNGRVVVEAHPTTKPLVVPDEGRAYDAAELDPVPMALWGKDHWTTFAYVSEIQTTKAKRPDARKMRTNPRVHRQFVGITPYGNMQDGSKYPTKLKGNDTIAPHDDWSCVEDFVAAGLVTVREVWRPKRRFEAFGCMDLVIRLTPEGRALWNRFEEHIAKHPTRWSTTFDPAK